LLVYLVPNFFINRQDFDMMYHLVGLSAGMSMVVKQRLSDSRAVMPAPSFEAAMAQNGYQVATQ